MDERGERLVERLHPVLVLSGLHHRVDLVELVLADEVPDRGRRDEDLHREAPALARRLRQERLAEDPLQDEGELRPHLRLLAGREGVDDPVHRLDGAVRVEGGERQVARLGDPEGGFHRLEVAHLADEDDVGVLAEDRAERVREGVRVGVQLTLVDDAALVGVEELDRVLDRDDVLGLLAVDLVDHRREGRRLARAGRPGDEDEAARPVAERFHDGRDPELLEAEDLVGDLPEDRRDGTALHEDVAAEPREALDPEGEVELEVLLETVLLNIGQDRVAELLGLRDSQRGVVQRLDVAVDSDHRRRVRRDVEVRAALLDESLQKLVQRNCHRVPL